MMERGLPVLGYQSQPQQAVDMVNANKEIEERILRMLDEMRDAGHQYDQRWLAIARTDIERGFMALNRAIFRPTRVRLPDDPP
jgi:hypothetical protein